MYSEVKNSLNISKPSHSPERVAPPVNYEQLVPLRLDRPLTTGELFRMLALVHHQKNQRIIIDVLTYMEFEYVDTGYTYKTIFHKDGKIELARPSQQGDIVNHGEWHTIIGYLQQKIKEVGKAELKRPAKIIPEWAVLQREKENRSYLLANVINPLISTYKKKDTKEKKEEGLESVLDKKK